MLSTGFVILDLDPFIGDLQNKAKRLLSQPPKAPKDLTYLRYSSIDTALLNSTTPNTVFYETEKTYLQGKIYS